MFPTEAHEQDVVFTVSRLASNPTDGLNPDVVSPSAADTRFAFSISRQREAALLHRNGRLRAIQALHRSAK